MLQMVSGEGGGWSVCVCVWGGGGGGGGVGSITISCFLQWFPLEMTSEKRAQKFHTDDVSLPRSGWCF